jgi:hypothetical protein
MSLQSGAKLWDRWALAANFDSGTPVTLFQATPRQSIPLYDLFMRSAETASDF